jgi:Fur family transcriptional regulator, peroxide stress response regulator
VSKLSLELDAAFRTAALRPTAQRFAVLEFLMRHPVHATAEEIFRGVNRSDPRASRATVYNSLRSLAQAGMVREVVSDGNAARFDASLHRHHHFICERCGAVEDIPWFDLPPKTAAGKLAGRTVRNYEILFRGLCKSCGTGNPK